MAQGFIGFMGFIDLVSTYLTYCPLGPGFRFSIYLDRDAYRAEVGEVVSVGLWPVDA